MAEEGRRQDQVAGDVMAEIETDKATMEVEAVDEGVWRKILIATAPITCRQHADRVLIGEGEDGKRARPRRQPAAPRRQKPSRRCHLKPAKQHRARSGRTIAQPSHPIPTFQPGTEMVTMTVREALRDAMAEEMRRDKDVFVMGEEVAEYQGAYKITQGLVQEFGPQRVIDTPITEHGFAGLASARP
jgi:pyruvate dehydrogenase E1 component beta subunit